MNDYYLGEMLVAAASGLIAWFASRRQQKNETRRIEVDVLEKALQVINKDVVEPLEERLGKAQEDLKRLSESFKKLQHAINKIYECRYLSSCPVGAELQRQKGNQQAAVQRNQRTRGQRQPSDARNGEAATNTALTGDAPPDAL
jgi:Flp pilus assembly protein TadB